jgi:hypothetical protein
MALSGTIRPNLGTIGLKEEGRSGESKGKHYKYSPVTIPESSRSLIIPDFWRVVI